MLPLYPSKEILQALLKHSFKKFVCHQPGIQVLKFIYSEKATKFCPMLSQLFPPLGKTLFRCNKAEEQIRGFLCGPEHIL